MDFLLHDVLPFIGALTVLIFIHEFGHYQVARWCGVHVDSFSIGFGPRLFGWKAKSGTDWKVCLMPLGGYVKMRGDTNATSAPVGDAPHLTEEEKQSAFIYKPLWQRTLIVLAGPVANFLLAIGIFLSIYLTQGRPYAPAIINTLMPNSAALKAGLQPGDHIIEINGTATEEFEDVRRIVALRPGETLDFTVIRDGKTIHKTIVPDTKELVDRFGNKGKIGQIGIYSTAYEVRDIGTVDAIKASVVKIYELSVDTLKAVSQIILGTRSAEELSGPLGIAQMSSQQASLGWLSFIMFVAILSANLGLVNLLPIPALDGGHLMFYAAEAIGGKPVSERVQEYGSMLGIGLVISLMLFVTWNDISKLISG